jgi:hypothetical protein
VFVAAIVVVGAFSAHLVWRIRRNHIRRLIGELLQGYFEGRMSADQAGRRAREITGPGFLGGGEFFALAHSAFQRAADAKLKQKEYSTEDERELLSLSAALAKEFGLPERYRIEGWRAGRE